MTPPISFLIALQIDSEDRMSNLKISTNNLNYHFPNSEIIISELDSTSKIGVEFSFCKHIFTSTTEFFNKQKAYNIATTNSSNDIICLYDADIVMDPRAIKKSAELINNKQADIVWPYNGNFYDVPKQFHSDIDLNKSISNVKLDECTLFSPRSVGGVVFFNKQVFIDGGKGNEYFKGAGWEDNEIYERFTKLGYKRIRLDTFLLHLTHERKETSYNYNPHGDHNAREFARINAMNKTQLLNEIATWKWN